MELLIPGLILVALMVWASTKIKKTAAAAFEPETIETDEYSFVKPEGFLHVIDSPDHDFEAYSKESGDDDNQPKRATIEVDALRDIDLANTREQLRSGLSECAVIDETENSCRIEADAANETGLKIFYKLVSGRGAVYRMRFAVVSKHTDDYVRRIDETLDSFTVKTA